MLIATVTPKTWIVILQSKPFIYWLQHYNINWIKYVKYLHVCYYLYKAFLLYNKHNLHHELDKTVFFGIAEIIKKLHPDAIADASIWGQLLIWV